MTTIEKIIQKKKMLLSLGVYDSLSAKIAEEAGFEAIFLSGYSVAASSLGVPDIGLLTQTEMIDTARRVCQAARIPVIVDADTGYGGIPNVVRTVRELIALGAKGCFLEDQLWPKKCGHMSGKKVIPKEEHVRKIRAAIEARGKADFFIVARTDAREANQSLADAIDRALAYKKAGADGIFVEAPQSKQELLEISRKLKPPFVANMLEGGVTPLLEKEKLQKLGFKIAVYPLTGIFAVAKTLREVFGHLRKYGNTHDIMDKLLTFHDFHEIVGLEEFKSMDKKYGVK